MGEADKTGGEPSKTLAQGLISYIWHVSKQGSIHMAAPKEKLWNKNFIIASAANFLSACAFNLLMPTIPLYLSQELGIAHSKIGVILASYALALLLVRPFSGYMVDNYPRKLVYLISISCFMAVFVGYYFAVSVAAFIILRFIHGLFWGLASVSANTIAIDIIPSSRRAEGIGFFGVNMNIAMATAPFVAMYIYENRGFSDLITVAIGMGILAVFAVNWIQAPVHVKAQKGSTRRHADLEHPEDVHHPDVPPVRSTISVDRFVLVKAFPILFNQLFITFGWGGLAAYAVIYGQEIGITNPAFFFLFLASGIMVSRVGSGKLVDRGYIHQVVIFAIAVTALSFLAFSYFQTQNAYYISALFIGVGYGTLLPALQTIYINMAPASKRGTANSTYLTGFDIGVGLGMLTGAGIAEHFSFQFTYMLTAVLCGIGLLLYVTVSSRIFERHRLR